VNGIIPLYKPKGWTSHDCVMKIRKLLHIKKVGHTGTLDPEVEGVLPICIGEATKIIPFLIHLNKEYIANVSLGIATTTEDSEGDIVTKKDITSIPSSEAIDAILQNFSGTIQQTPPMYSAVRVKGKRLYEYARENIHVERPTREVAIHEIEQLGNKSLPNHVIQLRVLCSKGTYIRTLCVDIGKALGYPAHMSYLIRTKSDTFTLKETITFKEIETAIEAERFEQDMLQPIERTVASFTAMEVDKEQKVKVLQGQKFSVSDHTLETIVTPFKMMHQGKLLAMYEKHPTKENEIKPVRVFNMHKE